jgi:hypothetical protein
MAKLNETHTILLSSAARRPDGNLYPPPATLGTDMDRIGKAVAALVKGGYAEEVAVTASEQEWRIECEERFGAVITDAGRIAIGVEPKAGAVPCGEQSDASQMIAKPEPVADRPTKAKLVLSLLQREQGATLEELVEATGWLPHTTRAALTGIRKKGHDIMRGKRGDVTCYTLAV